MIFKDVRKVIADIIGIPEDEILLESDLYNELDIDSLDMSQILLALENKYKINIENEKVAEFKIVKDIVENIENKINS